MIAHPVETVGEENVIIGVSCLVILAAATVMTAKKSKKTIEFEVDCEMAPTKKEARKMIKKTLANIMKKNDAKTTLIQ